MKRTIGNRRLVTLIITLLAVGLPGAVAKDKKGVIMTIDGEEIPTEEFLYLFNKNKEQQTVALTLDEYLPLFEAYRLKVAEAKRLGVDTTTNFQKEIATYRRDLLQPVVADTVFLNLLVDEAMARENELVEASHIMIARTYYDEADKKGRALIDSIRTELLNGADFIDMAKRYSQDIYSASKGGYLGFAPAGTYPYSFEIAVYETPEGEISEVVQSHVGWHIVKTGSRKSAEEVGYPVKSRERIKEDVNRKANTPFDPRYQRVRENAIKNLHKKYPNVDITSLSDEDAYQKLMEAEHEYQYTHNADYRNLLDEYTNGSMLYEVSVINVWDKASNDSQGLQQFYESHKDKYSMSRPHAKGILVQALNDSIGELIKLEIAMLPKDSIVAWVKNNYRGEAVAERFNLPEGVNEKIDWLMFGKAAPDSTKMRNFAFYYVADGRVIEEPESYEDVKSSVVADYQQFLEQVWLEELKARHEVAINNKELARIRKQLE